LLRELAGAFGAVTAVLLLVMLGATLTLTLDRVARGVMPAQLLFSQVALRSIDSLPLILPLALFLGILLAYGRLYRDSEMAVIAASGMTERQLLRPVLALAIPLVAMLAVISLWGGPAAMRLSDRMIDAANRSLLVVGMEAGRFVEVPGRDAIVYVGEMSPDGTRFSRMFVFEEREGRVDITTAAEGALYQDRAGTERFLEMTRGFRVEGTPGEPAWRLMRFARNELRLPNPAEPEGRQVERRRGFVDLLDSDALADRAELHWRIGLPISALMLALLAVPLARSPPREPRYGKVLVAIMAYVLYTNLMTIGRGWILDGTLPPAVGLWWLHAAALAAAWWLAGADRRALRVARR
jgi:lipopolysaccharide export system permease protein